MSWVIREKSTGRVICETFSAKAVAALNTAKYEAVPILDKPRGRSSIRVQEGCAASESCATYLECRAK
jgi:hypothetical protein